MWNQIPPSDEKNLEHENCFSRIYIGSNRIPKINISFFLPPEDEIKFQIPKICF